MKIQKGIKVKILHSESSCVVGRVAVVEHMAPGKDNTTVYRLRIGDVIIPGWYTTNDFSVIYRPYSFLIFDVDGTVSDTSEGVMKSLNHALEHFNIQHDNKEELRKFVGLDLASCFRDHFMMNEKEVEQATELFWNHYNSLGIYDQKLFYGMTDLLGALKKEGFTLIAFSMRPLEDIKFSLEYLDALDYFDHLCGMELHKTGYSESEMLEALLKTIVTNGDYSDFAMIGDGPEEMIAAKAYDIDSIGVLWGYGSKKDLTAAGARFLANDLNALARLL